MKNILPRASFFTMLLFVIFHFSASAQTTDTVGANADSAKAVQGRLIALRDDFVGKIKTMGYTPGMKPPEIVLDNPPSFGNFNKETDTLHTAFWPTLDPSFKGMFSGAASRAGNGMTGETYFEGSAHRWIFIHEMGHWWRACQHKTAPPYEEEMAANRIDISYWREKDPDFLKFKVVGFEKSLKLIPNPVPAGVSKEQYLNDNYDKLPGGMAYIWYQATMIVDGYNEKPALTFKQAIDRAGNTHQ